MKKQWKNRKSSITVSFKNYWNRVWDWCHTESIGTGPLGEYFCYVMTEMSDAEFERRISKSAKTHLG